MFSKQGTIIGCIALLALVLFAGIGPVMGMTQGTGEAAGSSAAPVLLQTPRLAGTLSTPTTATPMVAAGNGHTVGLKSDGTVVAVGENDDGQCDVTGWNDIVQVDAGFSHTVGLKADGTVIAVGNNYFGQCGVSGWSDVVQVAAGGDHTVGLKSDGTAVAVGENDDGQCNVSGWSDIVQVSAGLSHTVGLKSDGTAVAAPPGLDTWDLDGEGKPGIGDTWAYRGTDSGETFDWAETVTAHESLNGSMCYKTETVYDPAWQVSVEGYDVDLTVEGFRGWRGVSDRAWRLWQLDIEISGSPLTVSMEYAYTSSPYGAPFSFGKSWSYHTAQLSSPYSYDSTATVAGSLE
ncbi:MAG: hypothetical protein FJZ95_05065, partial [Chloroflexi bacterium]|nr:hypothetical protein [Chloroflexota bacterium]